MGNWDVFHADRLELERGLDAEAIRSALARGELRDDDLVRPAGSTTPWARIEDIPELMTPPAAPAPGVDEAALRPRDRLDVEDFEEVQPKIEEIVPPPARHEPTLLPDSSSSDVTFPVLEEEAGKFGPGDAGSAPKHDPSPGWTWDDDDDDNDDDEDDGEEEEEEGAHEKRHVVLEDRGDIEILADESDLEELDRGAAGIPAGPGPHRGHASAPGHEPAAARLNPDAVQRWDRSGEDLDLDTRPESQASHVALPVVRSRDRDEGLPEETGEDADAEFSLSRKATEKIEELDLAPMVDVAFNLVLFFMVTATTVLYKTLEIPKPSGEAPASAVAQGRSRTLDDLKADYILVEIDDRGAMKFDREPIEPVRDTLVERMRTAREKTGRKSMLLSADFATAHRNAVLAYDAANEIGLGIAIAKPQPPQGPAPALRPAAAAAKPAAAPAGNLPSP